MKHVIPFAFEDAEDKAKNGISGWQEAALNTEIVGNFSEPL